tara:strand:+ start:2330 stop:4579 length:2250 start_codon:yes stop_codon:yes gene_type:complete
MITAISNRSDDLLARLAAQESIHVQHDPNASTASFDLRSRTLVMPVWEDMTRDIRHMLTFHEIAHALYTPFDEWRNACDEHGSSLRVYCNIVEDARIERMIKAKFPGARRDFLDGYRKLHERDLFEIADKDIASLSIGDRINLHYKIGFVETIPFAADELEWIDRIDAAKTFADVIEIAIDLRDAMKDETPDTGDENEQGDTGNGGVETPDAKDNDEDGPKGNGTMSTDSDEDGTEDGENGEGGSGDDTDDTDSDETGSGSGDDESTDSDEGSESGAGMDDDTDDGESADSEVVSTAGAGEGDSKITTQEAFDRNMKETAGDASNERYIYRDLPQANLENVIIDYTRCHKRLADMFTGWTNKHPEQVSNFMREAGSFINGSAKTVNQMAQAFDMKKRAEVDRQTKISSTGELNMEELVNYRFSEDIFLRSEETPNGKNHGLIIMVDWSGSMCDCMEQTIRQMVQLVLFCKKVSIPFEVYAFTNNDFDRKHYNDDENELPRWKDTEIFGNNFNLLNLMSSRMNTLQYKAGLKHMMMLCEYMRYGNGIPSDYAFGLSGTPLDEAIACLNQIVPAFRAKNDLNIVNVAVLTDGCSNGQHWGHDDNGWGTPILRNKRNGATYSNGMGSWHSSMTENLLNYTRDETGANIIGIFLETGRDKRVVASLEHRYEEIRKMGYDAALAQWKENGFLSATANGYDEYFIMKATKNVQQIGLDDLDENASMTKIKNTFLKGAKGSKTSRVLLNQIMDHLA